MAAVIIRWLLPLRELHWLKISEKIHYGSCAVAAADFMAVRHRTLIANAKIPRFYGKPN